MKEKIVDKLKREGHDLVSIDTIIMEAMDIAGELKISWNNGGVYIGGYYRGTSVRGKSTEPSFMKAVEDLEYETGIGD
jgi:hypothetical protein